MVASDVGASLFPNWLLAETLPAVGVRLNEPCATRTIAVAILAERSIRPSSGPTH